MRHEEIYLELAECQQTGEFVAYHPWGDDSGSLLVGVVESLSQTSVVFRNVDPLGRYESIEPALALRRIHTLDRRTHYLWRLQTLHDLGEPESIEERDTRKAAQIREVLEMAAVDQGIVRIWTSAGEVNDYLVLSTGRDFVKLKNVTDGGPADGSSLIRLKRIVRVRMGRHEAEDLRVYRHWLETGFPWSRGDALPGL